MIGRVRCGTFDYDSCCGYVPQKGIWPPETIFNFKNYTSGLTPNFFTPGRIIYFN